MNSEHNDNQKLRKQYLVSFVMFGSDQVIVIIFKFSHELLTFIYYSVMFWKIADQLWIQNIMITKN